MTATTPVTVLLAKLHRCHQTVSDVFYETRVLKTDENALDIEMLRHFRLLSPDVRDAFRLRGSFRQFLNTVLSTERLYAIGANIGGHFERLAKLIDEHAYAFNEARDSDCERYEVELREAISDVADAVEDDLSFLEMQVSTKFGAVSTLAEKRRQNLFYLVRTQDLVDLLEDFHFSGFGDQLAGNAELALSFRNLLEERLPAFREQLKSILHQLNQYLFEFRRVEERAKSLRRLSMHFARNPDWQPQDWDAVSSPPEWITLARPLNIAGFPDTRQPESEDILCELARSIHSAPGIKMDRRPSGTVITAEPAQTVVLAASPIRKAIREFLQDACSASRWLSARAWWLEHPSLTDGITEDIWLLRVLSETDKRDTGRQWKFHFISSQPEGFNGNVLIRDIFIAPLNTPGFDHA